MRRGTASVAVALTLLATAAVPAVAHVSVRPEEAAKGETTTLTFRVPNERDDAATTEVVIQLPPGRTFATVEPQPVAGWTASVGAAAGTTTVTWRGGTITGENRQELPLRLGPLPSDVDVLVFKALQTYDDGEVVRWIEEQAPGGPEPEHPAPTLRLSGPIVTQPASATGSPPATGSAPATTDDVTVTTADDPVIGGTGDAAADDDGVASEDEGGGGSGAAIVVAVLVVLAVAGGGVALARRRRA